MAKRACKYIVIIFLIYTARILGAQTESSAVFKGWQLYHSEGEITITQSGVRTIYRAETEKPREILLISQDMIQTGKGTAEIQLVTDKPVASEKTYTIIKMGENTSFLVNRLENKEITLELLYGRVRIVTGTAEPGIVLRIGTSLTTLRNCDTGIDYIIRPGVTLPVLSLHCFSGQGEIIPRYTPGTETAKFLLKADETFSLEYRAPYSYMERKGLDSQILAYWQSNPFTPGAPLPIPRVELAEITQGQSKLPQNIDGSIASASGDGTAMANDLTQADNSLQTNDSLKVKRSKKINVVSLVTGLILASSGAALTVYSNFGNPDPTFKQPLFYGSFVPIGLGTFFIIRSFINPKE